MLLWIIGSIFGLSIFMVVSPLPSSSHNAIIFLLIPYLCDEQESTFWLVSQRAQARWELRTEVRGKFTWEHLS